MAKKTPAQLVQERLALAAAEAAKGNTQAAANYAQAAANIQGSGQAKVQAVAQQYAQAAAQAPSGAPSAADTSQIEGGRSFAQVAPQAAASAAPTESDEDRRDRQTAEAFRRDMLTRFGMGDLAGDIDRLVRESGNNTSVLMNNIRKTQSYQDRFKGFVALQQRGINDLQTEADYINLETEYRQVFRDSGVQNFLGEAGSKAERDAIAKLVGDFSLSVNEVRDRVSDAQRVVANTPQEVRDSLQKFYNVDPAMLVSYVLDPTRTSDEINRRANAAIVGGYATRSGLDFGAGVSERVGQFLSGGNDLSTSVLEPQITGIADVQRSTQRLAEIEKGVLSAEESALSTLDLDIEAKEKIRGLQSRERARFGGTSALTSSSLSRGKVI